MTKPVLVVGGYGNFGKRIAHALPQKNISVIIAGISKRFRNASIRSLMLCGDVAIMDGMTMGSPFKGSHHNSGTNTPSLMRQSPNSRQAKGNYFSR